MTPLRCDHIHLIAYNIDEAAQWYCRVLGGKITFEGKFRGSKVYYLDVAGTTFVVFGKLENDPVPVPGTIAPKAGVDHFGFSVSDLGLFLKDMKGHGVTILEGPITVRPGLRIAYIEGPDHIRIELCERQAP